MKKKYRILIIFLVLILSSVSMLFTLAQYCSIENELNSYIYDAPLSNFIAIGAFTLGNKSFHSAYAENMAKYGNKLESLVLGTAEEMFTPIPNPKRSKEVLQAALSEEEIKKIEKLNGIKSVYMFNVATDGQFDWKTNMPDGKKILALPISADFLNALHPLLAYGRYFNKSDGQNVCVLSYGMSKELFGTANSIGKTITVYGGSDGPSKYRVVGVLSKKLEDARYATVLPFIPAYGFFIPYDPAIKSGLVKRHPNLSIPDNFNNLFIVPQKGKYNYLMRKIKEILGKDYPYLVSSLPLCMKYTLGARIRYNRIKTLGLVSVLIVITVLFTLIEFLILEINLRRKEIGIKRALGKTIRGIAFDKIKEIFIYYVFAFAIAVIIVHISLPYVSKYTKLGYMIGGIVDSTLSQTVHLTLSAPAVLIAFLTILVSVYVSVVIFVSRMLKNPPSILIKGSEEMYKHNSRFALVIILSLCAAVLFTSLSIINVQKNEIITLYNETSPDIIRIGPFVPFGKYNAYAKPMSFSYEDYLVLKDKLKGKAIIGYRYDNFPQSIGKLGDSSFIRLVQATEQYPELYDFSVLKGRFIKDSDFNKFVCVVGESLAKSKNLTIGSTFMGKTVIGIVKGNNFLVNHSVYVPINSNATAESIAKNPDSVYVGTGLILLKPINGYSKDDVIKITKEVLIKRHPGKDAPRVVHLKEMVDSIYQARVGTFIILSIFILLALLSAFLSLSALLFIEVIRRTREIGIKKAIGATAKDITKEFTMNGLTTTLIALIIGIPTGIAVSLIIEKLKGWNYYIPINILILVTLISLLLGSLFSYLPALFASKTNPVEAIKSE